MKRIQPLPLPQGLPTEESMPTTCASVTSEACGAGSNFWCHSSFRVQHANNFYTKKIFSLKCVLNPVQKVNKGCQNQVTWSNLAAAQSIEQRQKAARSPITILCCSDSNPHWVWQWRGEQSLGREQQTDGGSSVTTKTREQAGPCSVCPDEIQLKHYHIGR